MDENNNLLTVKEFAQAAGVTVQAIYPRIKTDLKPYFKNENGQKLIDKAGLEIFIKTVPLKDFKELESNFKGLENAFKDALNQIKELEKQLENKEDEISSKRELIDSEAAKIDTLQDQLREKDEQLRRLEADFAKLKDELTDMRVKLAEVEAILKCKDELIAEKNAHNETLQAALALQAATNTKQGKAITVQAETAPGAENEHDPTEKKHGLLWSLLHRGKE